MNFTVGDLRYHNPANRSATISFDLPRAADTSLRLYDLAGREVAVLVNERCERGRHVIPVATNRLAAGAYYYMLRTGNDALTRKMMVG